MTTKLVCGRMAFPLGFCNWYADGNVCEPSASDMCSRIYFLRQALGCYRELIVTCRGRGYRLAKSLDEAQAIADERTQRCSQRSKSRRIRLKRPR